jgi:hypothetical protein
MPALEYLTTNSLVSYPFKPRKELAETTIHPIGDDWFYDLLFTSYSDTIRSVYLSKIKKTSEGSLELSFSSTENEELLGVAVVAADFVVNHYKNLSNSFAGYSSNNFAVKFVFGPGLIDKAAFEQEYTFQEAELANSAIVLNKPQLRTLRFESLEFDASSSAEVTLTEIHTYNYPDVPVVKPQYNSQFTLDSLNSGSLYVIRGAGAGLYDACPKPGEIEDVYTLNSVSPDLTGALFLKPSSCYTANTLTASARTLLGNTLSKYENFKTISTSGEVVFKDVVHVGHSITFENFCKPKCPPENLGAFAHYLNRVSDGVQELDTLVTVGVETRGQGTSELQIFTAEAFCVAGDDVFARCSSPEDPRTHIECGNKFVKNYHEGRTLQIYYTSLTVRNYIITEVIDDYRVRLNDTPPPAQEGTVLSFRVLDNGVISNLNCAALAYNQNSANFLKTYFKVAYATNECYNSDGVYTTNVAVIVSLYNPAPTLAQVKVLFEPTVLSQITGFKVRTLDNIYTVDTPELVLNCREYASIEVVFGIPCATDGGNLSISVLEKVADVWTPVGDTYNLPEIDGAECPGTVGGNGGGAVKYRITQENWQDFDKVITFTDDILSVSEIYGSAPSWLEFSPDPVGNRVLISALAQSSTKESTSYNLYFRTYGAVTTIWQIILNYIALPEIIAPLSSRFSTNSPLQLSKENIYTEDNPVLQIVATNMQPLAQDPPSETDVYNYSIIDGSLPAGLALDSATGKITGQLSASIQPGTVFYVLLSAQNPAGSVNAPQLIHFEVAVENPPALSLVSPPADEVYSTDNLITHTVEFPLVSFSVTNGPVYGFILQGNLPAGLFFNSSTGTITGRVSATTPASRDFIVYTSNVYGQSNQISFTIAYSLFDAPEIISPEENYIIEASVKAESTLSSPLFTISALQAFGGSNNFAEGLTDSTRNYYLAAGGPPGFTLDYYTGKFYGKLLPSELKAPGASYTLTYALRIGAYNPVGSASRTVLIKLYGAQAPTIIGIEDDFTLSVVKGVTYNANRPLYKFRTLNSPTSFSVEGLPTGLSCSPTGAIVGTVATSVSAGSYTFTAVAINAEGSSEPVTGSIIVPVSIISPSNNSSYFATVDGETSTIFNVTACDILAGDSITLTAEDLPEELTFSVGNVSGAFTSPRVYTIRIVATSNNHGTASVLVKLNVGLPTFSVSGIILDGLGNPVEEVLLKIGTDRTAINDAEGRYTMVGLSPGSYNITASSETHTLIPSFRVIAIGTSNISGVDFTAEIATRLVKGTVRDEFLAGIPGVIVSDGITQAVTDSFGVYTLYLSRTDTAVITPYSPLYAFNPTSGSIPPDLQYFDEADFAAIPSKATAAPYIASITEGNAELEIIFTAPEDDGGTEIINYEYSVNSGLNWTSIDPPQITSPIVVTSGDSGTGLLPLENGKIYGVSIRALNLSGAGSPSLILFATPATVAPTPTITSHSVTGNSVSLDFTLPTNTTGAKVTSIEYSLDDGVTYTESTNTGSPLTLRNLTVGNSYTAKLRAINSKGAGEASESYSFLVTAPPEPPVIQSIIPQDSQLTVNFEPPTFTGGAAIVNVGYSIAVGDTYTYPDPPSAASPIVLTNLENGTTYRISLIALNAAGSYSEASGVVLATPTQLPDAPTDLVVAPLPAGLRISFSPSTNSSAFIENYKYQLDGGSWLPMSPARQSGPISILGLTNGTQYSVKLRAVVSAGDGVPSEAVQGTPAKIASAPKLNSITPFPDSLEVFFKKSEDLGGSALLDYNYSIDGGRTYTVATVTDIAPDSGKFTITSLVTGTSYSILLKARTAVGLGEVSNALSGTPIATPSAPLQLSVAPEDKAVVLRFTAPANTGGAVVTNYKYQLNSEAWQTRTPASNSTIFTIRNLVNGKFYYLKLRAVNAAGDGTESESVSFVPATTPSAPTITKIYGREKRLQVIFTPPANDGGSFITGYQYSVDGGLTFKESNEQSTGATQEDSPEAPYIIIDKLFNGTSYAVILRAMNYVGVGATSNTVTGKPIGTPPAPTITSASSTPGGALVRFTPPSTNGGSAITTYAYFTQDSAGIEKTVVISPAVTASPITITDLPVGERVVIKICAVNSYGNGTFSAEASVIPGAPAVPTITSVTGIDRALVVKFTPAASTAGAPATSYEYSTDAGLTYFKTAGTTSPFTISNLVNGSSYSVQLRAVNAVSSSSPSNVVSGQPTNLPTAPTITGVTSHEGYVLMYFTPPVNDGGLAVLGYKYSLDGVVFTSGNSTASPLNLPGLNIGTTYNLYVKAFNVSGDGATSAAFPVTIGTPAAPSIDFIDSNNTAVTVSFTLPEDGGAPLLNIQYALNGSSSWVPVNPPITESPLTLTSALTANTRYTISIRAVNSRGPGTPSNTVSIAKGLSSAPQIESILPENGTLTLNILPPGNYTQPIVDYKYNVYTDTDAGIYTPFNATTFPITSLTIPIND